MPMMSSNGKNTCLGCEWQTTYAIMYLFLLWIAKNQTASGKRRSTIQKRVFGWPPVQKVISTCSFRIEFRDQLHTIGRLYIRKKWLAENPQNHQKSFTNITPSTWNISWNIAHLSHRHHVHISIWSSFKTLWVVEPKVTKKNTIFFHQHFKK